MSSLPRAVPAASGEEEGPLEQRLGRLHARQRLSMEEDHEARVFGGGMSFFHLENWYSAHTLIRLSLKLTGLYGRGKRNAFALRVVHHDIALPHLPTEFDGLRLLQLTDMHLDQSEQTVTALIECVRRLEYDATVLTGDYRFRTYGSIDGTVLAMQRLREHLNGPVYGVLGNHDSIRMVPPFERLGIRMLLNEYAVLERGAAEVYLVGVDDAHYFGCHNLEKAAEDIPPGRVAILLSHTPELYRQAAHAGIDVLLSGHTHGGQICLPGGYPVTLDARIPRRFGRGRWQYARMIGYTSPGSGTSMVGVRLNCPPEVTIHRFIGRS